MTQKPPKKRKVHDVSLAPREQRVRWAEKSHTAARQGRIKVTLPSIPNPRKPT